MKSEMALLSLCSESLLAYEDEIKRIAGELHDCLRGSLTAMRISLKNIQRQLGDGAGGPELLEIPIARTQYMIDEVGKLLGELYPSLLDDIGLIAALGWLFRQYRMTYPQVHIEEEILIGGSDIPEVIKIVIFRITQEAFHNIAKHSNAEYVSYSLLKKDAFLELNIEDNGDGFDLEAFSVNREKRGLGIISMNGRTRFSGGTFTIRSIPGEGTAIQALWPVA